MNIPYRWRAGGSGGRLAMGSRSSLAPLHTRVSTLLVALTAHGRPFGDVLVVRNFCRTLAFLSIRSRVSLGPRDHLRPPVLSAGHDGHSPSFPSALHPSTTRSRRQQVVAMKPLAAVIDTYDLNSVAVTQLKPHIITMCWDELGAVVPCLNLKRRRLLRFALDHRVSPGVT